MLVSNTLPATPSRTDWSFTYVPASDATAPADGTLAVTEEQGKRVRRTITATYGVQFAAPVCGHRCVLLVKDGHAGDLDTVAGREAAVRCGDVYRVVLNGGHSTCSCPGFALGRRRCKHMLALLALVATGDLPDPQADADADRGDTEAEDFTVEPEPEDVPFGWFRRREAAPAQVASAAAFLRALDPPT